MYGSGARARTGRGKRSGGKRGAQRSSPRVVRKNVVNFRTTFTTFDYYRRWFVYLPLLAIIGVMAFYLAQQLPALLVKQSAEAPEVPQDHLVEQMEQKISLHKEEVEQRQEQLQTQASPRPRPQVQRRSVQSSPGIQVYSYVNEKGETVFSNKPPEQVTLQ